MPTLAVAPPRHDPAALAADNRGLVYLVVRQTVGGREVREADREDLVGAGMVGLVRAAQEFDPSRGWAFATFACKCIKHRVWRERHLQRRRGREVQAAEDAHEPPLPVWDGRGVDLPAEVLDALADALGPRERWILLRRAHGDTLDQLGRVFGVSRQRIRQIEAGALAKVRSVLGLPGGAAGRGGPS